MSSPGRTEVPVGAGPAAKPDVRISIVSLGSKANDSVKSRDNEPSMRAIPSGPAPMPRERSASPSEERRITTS